MFTDSDFTRYCGPFGAVGPCAGPAAAPLPAVDVDEAPPAAPQPTSATSVTLVALVGCGAAGGASSTSTAGNGAAAGPAQGPTAPKGPQYLVKSLSVNMSVTDPRQTAAALQTWVTTTDLQATSEGLNYQQIGNNQYDVTLTF